MILLSFGIPLRAEIIDRVAVSVGNQVITEQQIDEQVRLTAFQNHEKLNLSAQEKKNAANRLIEQALVVRDLKLSLYPEATPSEADAMLKSEIAHFPDEAAYRQALRDYGISEDRLRKQLEWQVTLLRFVEYRFRPAIQIPDAEVEAFYKQQVPKWQQQGVNPIPSFEDSRDSIEEILTQQRIDQALDHWLEETRKQSVVRYRDEALQ